jgi:ABC-2 type transport system permease protein
VIRALRAEWTKTRTLPGTFWLLAASALGAAFGRTGVQIGQVAIVVLAVQVIGNEYGTGLIRPTLTAIPNRALVFAGKLTVVAAGAAVTGGTHAPYLTLIAIYSLGTATVIRDSAGAVVTVLATLFVPPLLARLAGDPDWHHRLTAYAPTTASLGVLAGYAGLAALTGLLCLQLRDA